MLSRTTRHSTWFSSLLPPHSEWLYQRDDIDVVRLLIRYHASVRISSTVARGYVYMLDRSTNKENRICLDLTLLTSPMFYFASFFPTVIRFISLVNDVIITTKRQLFQVFWLMLSVRGVMLDTVSVRRWPIQFPSLAGGQWVKGEKREERDTMKDGVKWRRDEMMKWLVSG
jgi:hypothetical protein